MGIIKSLFGSKCYHADYKIAGYFLAIWHENSQYLGYYGGNS
jgi:hypothetical protein